MCFASSVSLFSSLSRAHALLPSSVHRTREVVLAARSFPLRFARVLSPFLSSYYSRFPLARTSALPFHLPPFLIPLQPYNLRHTFSFIHVGTPHVRPQLQLPSNLSYRDLRLPRVLQRVIQRYPVNWSCCVSSSNALSSVRLHFCRPLAANLNSYRETHARRKFSEQQFRLSLRDRTYDSAS